MAYTLLFASSTGNDLNTGYGNKPTEITFADGVYGKDYSATHGSLVVDDATCFPWAADAVEGIMKLTGGSGSWTDGCYEFISGGFTPGVSSTILIRKSPTTPGVLSPPDANQTAIASSADDGPLGTIMGADELGTNAGLEKAIIDEGAGTSIFAYCKGTWGSVAHKPQTTFADPKFCCYYGYTGDIPGDVADLAIDDGATIDADSDDYCVNFTAPKNNLHFVNWRYVNAASRAVYTGFSAPHFHYCNAYNSTRGFETGTGMYLHYCRANNCDYGAISGQSIGCIYYDCDEYGARQNNVINCLFYDNGANTDYQLDLNGSAAIICGCTFVASTQYHITRSAGAVIDDAHIMNCIFDGHTTAAIQSGAAMEHTGVGMGGQVDYCLFNGTGDPASTGVALGANNIYDEDPLLDNDYMPTAKSPCIGAGYRELDIGNGGYPYNPRNRFFILQERW
jgi:hypothetical protein